MERLHWVRDTCATWQGPVSVVVFAPDKEFDIAQFYISFLRSESAFLFPLLLTYSKTSAGSDLI